MFFTLLAKQEQICLAIAFCNKFRHTQVGYTHSYHAYTQFGYTQRYTRVSYKQVSAIQVITVKVSAVKGGQN